MMMKGEKRVPSAAAGAFVGFLLWLTVFRFAQRGLERMAEAASSASTGSRV